MIRHVVLLLGLAAVLFLANTWGYDLWPADEPRFGEVGREMMQSHNYLAPHCNGQPYKEKPPLLPWSIVLASLPFGDVNEFSARVPSGVAGVVTVLFTFLIAARLYSRRVAAWSAVILMTTALFWWEARSVRCDMLLTAALTAYLYFFVRWRENGRVSWLVAMYAALAAGLYAKGPPALLFPLLLLVFFYWKRGGERRVGLHLAGFAVALLAVLAWFIPARLSLPPAPPSPLSGGGMGTELLRQTIGRFILGGTKAAPPWYYVVDSPANLFPWSLFLPWTLPWIWRRRKESDAMHLLLAWTVPALVFFSICIGKRAMYILPLYPAFAILTARSVLDLVDGDHALWRKRTAYVWGGLLLIIGAACWTLLLTPYRDLVNTGLVALSVCALVLGLDTLRRAWRTDMRLLPALCAAHFSALTLLAVFGVFPALNEYKGASDFCRPLRDFQAKAGDYRLYSVGFSREEYIFYARHFHEVALDEMLPVAMPGKQDVLAMAKQQALLRRAILKAVEKVPVASVTAPTDAEKQALREAIHTALRASKVDAATADAFEQAFREAVQAFARDFGGDSPAFLFVQEDDWKWLAPLMEDTASYHVIKQDSVGRRDVLLIGNDAAHRGLGALPPGA